jgi:hypothetical protein
LLLLNKTNSSQRLIWDEISFIGTDGKSDRVIHEGVKIVDRGVSMPPTVVFPGSTLLDLIEPTGHLRAGLSGSDTPLIGYTGGTSEAEVRSKMVHGTIKVPLPIDTNGTIHGYLFEFSVKGSVVLSGWSS